MLKYHVKRYGCETARRAVREARSVRARQDGERGGGDGEEKRKLG